MHAHYGMPLTTVGHAHNGADDPTHGEGGAHTHPQTDPGFGDVVPPYTDAHTHGLAYAAPDLLAALELAITRIRHSERYGCLCGETDVPVPCGHCVWTQAYAAIAKARDDH